MSELTQDGPQRPTLVGDLPKRSKPVKATLRQHALLTFIDSYSARNGRSPSIREIGRAFGIGSTNGVADHLKALRRKGLLTQGPVTRSLVLTPLGRSCIGAACCPCTRCGCACHRTRATG